MSLSQPKVINPCKKFIEFKGNSGNFQYWDKEAKSNVIVPHPTFIVLDELNTVTGYSDQYQCGIYANEVHNLSSELLNVRSFKGGLKIVGKYSEIKGDIGAAGGKYCKSVYAALIHANTELPLELVNFRLSGIAFSSWMDYEGTKAAVQVTGCTDGKKGSVKFKIPTFAPFDCGHVLIDQATQMDKDLQAFLKEYMQTQAIKDESVQHHPADDLDEDGNPNPFK